MNKQTNKQTHLNCYRKSLVHETNFVFSFDKVELKYNLFTIIVCIEFEINDTCREILNNELLFTFVWKCAIIDFILLNKYFHPYHQ